MNKTNEMKGIPAIMSEHRNAESVVKILRRIEAKIDALATSAPATKTKDKAPPKYNSRDSILAAITAYMKPGQEYHVTELHRILIEGGMLRAPISCSALSNALLKLGQSGDIHQVRGAVYKLVE